MAGSSQEIVVPLEGVHEQDIDTDDENVQHGKS
jgi:hypothetical protein